MARHPKPTPDGWTIVDEALWVADWTEDPTVTETAPDDAHDTVTDLCIPVVQPITDDEPDGEELAFGASGWARARVVRWWRRDLTDRTAEYEPVRT